MDHPRVLSLRFVWQETQLSFSSTRSGDLF